MNGQYQAEYGIIVALNLAIDRKALIGIRDASPFPELTRISTASDLQPVLTRPP